MHFFEKIRVRDMFVFVLFYMSVFSCHKKSSYGSCFNSTIGGLFFLLSVFTGLVQNCVQTFSFV